jgi:outer membrane protein assembly factor BamE (lipoprotein component of BamABCDE complex)
MTFRTWGGAIALATLSALTACSTTDNLPDDSKAAPGKAFSPGAFATLAVGYASREAALAAMGITPNRSDVVVLRRDLTQKELPSPVVVQRLYFAYAGPGTEGTGVESRAHRDALLTFSDGHLIGFLRTSTFAVDSTAFREALVGRLRKGSSTQSEVRQLLGAPAGQSIYPLAVAAGHTRWVYWQQWWGGNGWYGQTLKLDFDTQGVLKELALEAGRNE